LERTSPGQLRSKPTVVLAAEATVPEGVRVGHAVELGPTRGTDWSNSWLWRVDGSRRRRNTSAMPKLGRRCAPSVTRLVLMLSRSWRVSFRRREHDRVSAATFSNVPGRARADIRQRTSRVNSPILRNNQARTFLMSCG